MKVMAQPSNFYRQTQTQPCYFIFWVNPPTSHFLLTQNLCISWGHYWKWHHKAECIYVSWNMYICVIKGCIPP